jgi:fucose 4-O-acetylase-like acetyltransferase
MREWNGNYATTGYIDTMEYSEGNVWVTKNLKKLIVPVMLGNANCSIKVYLNINQAWFVLLDTLDQTRVWTLWFKAVEVPTSFAWNTLQVRYELITASSTYSPKLYVWQNIVNEVTETGKSRTYGN